MNNSTSIVYAEVKEGISVVRDDCLPKIKNIFSEFESVMKRVGGADAFVGDANESLQQRANKFSSRFNDFEKLVLQFSTEFEKALESTQRTEQKLAEEAGNLNA